MLTLPAPYGLGEKSIHCSIRAPRHKAIAVRNVAEKYGCPKFISIKIRDCIWHSERYDSLLMPDIDTHELQADMLEIGAVAIIAQMSPVPNYANSAHQMSQTLALRTHMLTEISFGPEGVQFLSVYDYDSLQQMGVRC